MTRYFRKFQNSEFLKIPNFVLEKGAVKIELIHLNGMKITTSQGQLIPRISGPID